MNDANLKTIRQIKEFLEGSDGLEFKAVSVEEKKTWIEDLLIRFDYLRLRRNEKGVYHINAVDEVTQWEIVASVEKISEAYLVPVLGEMLAQFPNSSTMWLPDC